MAESIGDLYAAIKLDVGDGVRKLREFKKEGVEAAEAVENSAFKAGSALKILGKATAVFGTALSAVKAFESFTNQQFAEETAQQRFGIDRADRGNTLADSLQQKREGLLDPVSRREAARRRARNRAAQAALDAAEAQIASELDPDNPVNLTDAVTSFGIRGRQARFNIFGHSPANQAIATRNRLLGRSNDHLPSSTPLQDRANEIRRQGGRDARAAVANIDRTADVDLEQSRRDIDVYHGAAEQLRMLGEAVRHLDSISRNINHTRSGAPLGYTR